MYLYIDSESCPPTDERELIEYYFNCGYSYAVILEFLGKYHGISISLRTLKRRLNAYGLKKKEHVVDVARVRELVKDEMAHAGAQSGYRSIWHALRHVHNIHPPRQLVADILRELDPEASLARRSRRLSRRKYLSPGPNYCWHVDGKFNFYIYFIEISIHVGYALVNDLVKSKVTNGNTTFSLDLNELFH